MNRILLSALFIFFSLGYAQAQAVSINTDGSPPDPSAILDMKSTDKGVLVPRMTTGQRTMIAAPATGLLVFDTNTGSFWFYTGSAWTNLVGGGTPVTSIADTDGNTKVQTEESPNENVIRFDLNGSERMVLRQNAGGTPRLELISSGDNTSVGANALLSNTSGFSNTAFGDEALRSTTTGNRNTALGNKALYTGTNPWSNVAVGDSTLFRCTSCVGNTAVGNGALLDVTDDVDNTAVGIEALYKNKGNSNTALGSRALTNNQEGFHNIAIGVSALAGSTNGNHNIAIGRSALSSSNLEFGFGNTAAGVLALSSNTSGFGNTGAGFGTGNTTATNRYATFIGYDADFTTGNFPDVYYSTAIGYNARVDLDNQVRIGYSGITSIGGFQNWTNISDGRYKNQVQEDVKGLDFIRRLRPVTYQLDVAGLAQRLGESTPEGAPAGRSTPKEQIRYTGFIAQEVAAAARQAGFAFSGVDAPQQSDGL